MLYLEYRRWPKTHFGKLFRASPKRTADMVLQRENFGEALEKTRRRNTLETTKNQQA